MQLKVGGILHLKLNISKRPIANKYREGKMKRTLKRECKGLEIAKREAAAGSSARAFWRAQCQHQLRAGEIARGEGLLVDPCAVPDTRLRSILDADEMPVPDPS